TLHHISGAKAFNGIYNYNRRVILMATCHFCGGELIWGGDHDAQECGYEREGILTNLTCSSCGAYWEGVCFTDKEECEDE
ncbi:MAG: hypothetical protein ACRCZ0_11050, partial [Cetobacterium sp.]